MIILKVTKKQGFTLYLEDTFFEKPQGGQIDPPPPTPPSRFRVNHVMYFGLKKAKINFNVYEVTNWKTKNCIYTMPTRRKQGNEI